MIKKIGIVIFILMFAACASKKNKIVEIPQRNVGMPALSELDSVLMQNIELSITSLLALNYEGKAVLNVYPNYLAVSFVEGKIVLNPNYPDNTNYSIASMDVGIGKETKGFEGSWEVIHKTPRLFLNEEIDKQKTAINISNSNFFIHYNSPSDLKDAWFVVSYYDGKGSVVYNQSQKIGHYFTLAIEAEIQEKLHQKFQGIPSEELIRKQFALQKEISYLKAQSYLEALREGSSYSSAYKMNFPKREENWKSHPQFSEMYANWHTSILKYNRFINEECSDVKSLNVLFQQKKITRDEFNKQRNVLFSTMAKKEKSRYTKYQELLRGISANLRPLWIKTLAFYLDEYTKNDKIFPSEAIKNEEIKNVIESEYFVKLQKELSDLENEIISRI